MIGAVVILVGALVAMTWPIYRLVQARIALDIENRHDYDAEHLRGDSGEYAIVEGGEGDN